MRGIRNLEPVAEKRQRTARNEAEVGWGGLQAATLACSIVGVPALAYAIFLIATPPKAPAAIAEKLIESVEATIESTGNSLSLDESFKWWSEIQNDGIGVRHAVPAELIKARQQYRVHRFHLWLSLGIACVALALAASLAFWRRQRVRS